MSLYNYYLPLVQSLNDYGGNFASIRIRQPVLEAIDDGASNDPALRYVQSKLHEKMQQWTGLQDHKTFSEFFEAYYEGVFYLVALHRGTSLRNIAAGSGKGNTPDFETVCKPSVNFEVKTIDLADPKQTYNKIMCPRGSKLNWKRRHRQNAQALVRRSEKSLHMAARGIAKKSSSK